IFDVAREYGFDGPAARKLQYTGYVHHDDRSTGATESIRGRLGINGDPLVIVTVGGGEDGQQVVGKYLEDLSLSGSVSWRSVVVLGPFMKGALRRSFRELGGVIPGVSIVDFTPQLRGYIAEADAIITMGGYNTLVEAIAVGKHVIVMPRTAPRREQLIRAKRFGERGLLRWMDPARCAPGDLLRVVVEALSAPRPGPPALDLCGVERTVRAIADLLGMPCETAAAAARAPAQLVSAASALSAAGLSHDHEEPLVGLIGDEPGLSECGEELPEGAAIELPDVMGVRNAILVGDAQDEAPLRPEEAPGGGEHRVALPRGDVL
ncbi:MAG TPA: glycosyltransferase, partial [Candidatus Methylomirabilis sp.]|nr:glycosyltransferase [Candidatus Methylomirabilis sp.]